MIFSRRLQPLLLTVPFLTGALGCSLDKLVGSADLPATVVDPAKAETPAGAKAAYTSTLILFRDMYAGSIDASFVMQTGVLSDELQTYALGAALFTSSLDADNRILPEGISINSINNLYIALQKIRGQANQARGLLTDFLPSETERRPLIGHLMTLAGYAELFLAEYYCSGIPLSTLDYKGNYTVKPGSPTKDVFGHAIALFDSALTLTGDSVRVETLARIGKSRALLQLGRFDEAAEAVEGIPVTYRYDLQYNRSQNVRALLNAGNNFLGNMSDREGQNGLPFLSERDARIPAPVTGWTYLGVTLTVPQIPAAVSFAVASGIEAELILAEVALSHEDPSWLTILNTLRTTTGGVSGLGTLSDPGLEPLPEGKTAADVRLDLLFRERAYWLYLRGYRLGDLRRLVRVYGRPKESVYPTGPYRGNVPLYGEDVNAPVPNTEKDRNPLYEGCIDRNA